MLIGHICMMIHITCYVLARLQQRKLHEGKYQYGELLRINLDTLEKNSTSIKCEKDVSMGNIPAWPVKMFEKSECITIFKLFPQK